MNRLGVLDGWRGAAILLVLIGHFFPVPFLNVGRYGVELFFVLSGRLMGEILFLRKESLARFYWRRITRIIPALYVFVFVLTTFSILTKTNFGLNERSLISSLTFSYNYLHNSPGFGTAFLDHLWSLCVEEHTYLVLGLVSFLMARSETPPWRVCIALAVVCMVNGAFMTLSTHQGYYDVYWRTDTRAGAILLGCGLYCLTREKPEYLEWLTPNAVVLLFGMSVVLSLYPVSDILKYSLGTGCLALCIATVERLPALLLKALTMPPLRFLGMASFSLYLYQQPFFHSINGNRTIMLALAVLCGLLSYYLVEKPARSVLNGLTFHGKQSQQRQ